MTQKRTLSPDQDNAANPSENVWVQANAGTGKTSVLIQRLLRILFRTPDLNNCGILCLTYTNAAAGEMRNRILASLREWAMASDADLADLLTGITVNQVPNETDLQRARQIFFFYIDNPDILKIKTIHGFWQRLSCRALWRPLHLADKRLQLAHNMLETYHRPKSRRHRIALNTGVQSAAQRPTPICKPYRLKSYGNNTRTDG